MSDHLFAAFDIGLIFAVAFGLAIWQLIAVRRSIRSDRKPTEPERPARESPEN